MRTLSSLVVLWLISSAMMNTARGDGGTVRLMEKRDPLQITVFTSPTPLRAGPVDVSVLVQNKSGEPIEQVVEIVARPRNGAGNPIRTPASRAAATNQLLQAAKFRLPHAGPWQFEVLLRPPDTSEHRLEFEADVAPALPRWVTFWPWFSWPLIAIGLFGVQQRRSIPR